MESGQNQERILQAYETAVKYLAVSPRSEKEVREKLYSKGFHKNEVEAAIEKAKGYRYIDDEQYVKTFIDYYGQKYGAKKLAYKLIGEKGIDKSTAENAIADMLGEDAQLDIAVDFASKYAAKKRLDKKDAPKVGAYLFQRGFDWSIINKAIAAVFDDAFTED